MNRADWLREKRRLCEERMDTLFAPIYDEHWGGSINAAHRYYPALDRVRAWAGAAGFAILDERDGDDYHHVLARAT